jgi:photosystem II stability/assembly factor-like uncharacterized protein
MDFGWNMKPVWGALRIIIIILVLSTGFFLGYMALTSGLMKGSYATCRASISATTEIKIVARRTDDGSGSFTFMITQDGGQSWKDFMYYEQEDAFNPKCQNVKLLDKENFWVWMGSTVGITHDGGRTWILWDSECCNYSPIADIRFENTQSGSIVLNLVSYETSSLITNDGGRNWH